MNFALPEMLKWMNKSGDITRNGEMSVLERQLARSKWQHEQQPVTCMNEYDQMSVFSLPFQCQDFVGSNEDQGLSELPVGPAMKLDPGIENGWILNYGSEFEMSRAIPRTARCLSAMVTMTEVATNGDRAPAVLPEMMSSAAGRDISKKRKADMTQTLGVVTEEQSQEKKMKASAEEESKITDKKGSSKSTISTTTTNSKKEPSADDSKEKMVSEVPKPDYIHVRARRGQATDSHSLAERVRREKISERMKYLQDLVPGCNKITGKAGMLDEIINYVQSLQRQVEFLSMKLAAINPRLDFDVDNLLDKEVLPPCVSNIPTIGVSTDMVTPANVQFSSLAQEVSFCGLETGINPPDDALNRTISPPVSIQETLLDSSCLNQIQYSNWDAELQNFYGLEYQQGRSPPPYISQPFTGFIEAGHVKLEM